MKRTTFLTACLITLILFNSSIFSQILFDKKYEGGVTTLYGDIVEDGFVFAGHYLTQNGNGYDAAIVRIDSVGSIKWSYKYGSTGSQDGFRKIRKTSDNHFLAAGYTNSFQIDYYWNFLVCKIDSTGSWVWGKEFGGLSADEGWDMMETSDSSYIAAGYTKSFGLNDGGGSSDIVLVKFSKDGNVIWKKVFGSEKSDWIYSMTECKDGGLLLTGNTYNQNDYRYYISLIKLDNNGNILWKRFFSAGYGDDYSYEVKESADKNIYLTGTINVFGVNRAFLAKTDSSGLLIWTKIFGGFFGDAGYSFEFTGDGGFIIGGYSTSYNGKQNPSMLKLTSTADIDWVRMFANDENGAIRNVKTTHDETYIGGGFTNDGMGYDKTYLVKTDEVGHTYCNSVIAQLAGSPVNLYEAEFAFAEFESDSFITVNFSKDTISLIETNSCELQGSIKMQSLNHSFVNGKMNIQWSTAKEENVEGFAIYKDLTVIGTIDGKGISDDNNTYNFVDNSTQAGKFTYRIKQNNIDGSSSYVGEAQVEIKDISLGVSNTTLSEFTLRQNFPNPFNPETVLSYSIPAKSFVNLKVYDILGNEIATLVNEEQSSGNYSVTFNGSSLASGIYYCVLSTDNFTASKKMILLK